MLAAAVLLAAAGVLPGCSSVIDQIPTWAGGLPDGVPPRPATQPAYPAVHDMPPARNQTTLSEQEKAKLEEDLVASRERAARQGTPAEETTAGTRPARPARNP